MPWHVVKQGECVASLAVAAGFPSEQALLDAPENAELLGRRPDPYSLKPGDRIFVPDARKHTCEGQTELRHRFVVRGPACLLRVRMLDEDDEPIRDRPFELALGQRTVEGRTGEDGEIEVSLSSREEEGVLTVFVWGDEDFHARRWTFRIGHLNPSDDDDGVRERLVALAHLPAADAEPEELRRALSSFQEAAGLPTTGRADTATCDALRREYDRRA